MALLPPVSWRTITASCWAAGAAWTFSGRCRCCRGRCRRIRHTRASTASSMRCSRRALLARLDPLLEALAARQYYEHLRWDVVRPALKDSWPDWRDADEYGRGQFA